VSTIAPVESIEHTYEQTCDRTPTRTKAVEMSSFKAQKEIKSLLFITEQYLSKTLSKSDVDAITYFYETLGMSADLIEYLVESCVENGHKSMHYIQKVALSWSDQQITTKEQARRQSASYNKNCYAVLRAFGIHSRGPAASEIAYIQKWTDELGFSIDLVQEACNRTISAIHQPSFEYADSILTNWHKKQVRHLKDLSDIDSAFQKERASRMHSVPMKSKSASKNLNNFERRAYDMDSLEQQLLNSN
jgi:DnaD/phage-associated family protein